MVVLHKGERKIIMNEEFERERHTLKLENRESLELSGIKDVGAFNEEQIIAESSMGDIIIKGSALHVDELSLDKGRLKVSGKISAFFYNDKPSGKGFWGKIFS